MITVGLQTFGQDGLEAHGRPKEVCLFEGLPPKKIEKNNSSALETVTEVTSALTGRGRAAAAQMEGVRRYSSSAYNALAITLAMQGQRNNRQRGVWRTEITHQIGTGERIWCSLQSTGWVTMSVGSSEAYVVGINSRRSLYSCHRSPQYPCWEAQFSGRWSFASPALCWDSDDHRLASTRGTPGSSIQSAVPLQTKGMPSTVVLRADAAVLLDWILTPEAAYSQLSNLPIDARLDIMSLGWALICDYAGANFTFWKHCNLFQRQKWHEHSWEALSVGRWAGPATCFSDSHSAARAGDPSLWFARYRPTFQELMDAEASSLEQWLDYGRQL
jgi:hypothetical protein